MNVIDKNIGRFLGIGVGIAGLVDAREGMVYYCPNLSGWNNVNLKKEIQKKIQTDIVIDDAVRFMALSEKRYGIAKDFDNYLYIYIGSGVGSGIVLNNRFYRGKHGISGEFGHMTIRHDGPICNCGNRGCLEALVSIDAILRMTHEALDNNIYSSLSADSKEGLTFEQIASAALNGDKLAGMILHDTAENIGIGSADLMNVFDPGVIIFNGELFHKYGKILEEVTQIVRLRGIAAISGRTEFHIGESNKWSGSRGAATAIIENYIESDILNI